MTRRSLHEVIIGEITPQPYTNDGSFKRPYVLSANVSNIAREFQNTGSYSKKAIMSLDGLYRPVSKYGDGSLPAYWVKNITSGDIDNFSKAALPPMVQDIEPNVEISVSYLDPLVHPSFSHHGLHSGHDIDMVAHSTGLSSKHISVPIARILGASDSGYYNDGRFFAIRGPIIMQGWGYDTNGYPVPNKIDVEESYIGTGTGAILNPTGQREFADNWLLRSDTWPVAPIDLRLDRERGVWTVPSFDLIRLTLTESLFNSSGSALYPKNGGGSKQVEVYDAIGMSGNSGDEIYAFYNTHENRLEQLVNQGKKDIIFELDGDLTANDASGTANIIEQFGAGLVFFSSSVILKNFETSTAGVYNFYGTNGARGLARWAYNNVYMIYQLECS